MMTIWLLFDLNSVTFLLWTSQLGLLLFARSLHALRWKLINIDLRILLIGYVHLPHEVMTHHEE